VTNRWGPCAFRTTPFAGSFRASVGSMTNGTVEQRRPASVVVVAVLMGLNGVGAIASALSAGATELTGGALTLNLLFGAGVLGVAWGLVMMRPWAWSVTLLLQVISLVTALVSWAHDPSGWAVAATDVLLSAFVLWLLLRRTVRSAFGSPFLSRRTPL
jgi:hypothetical protein